MKHYNTVQLILILLLHFALTNLTSCKLPESLNFYLGVTRILVLVCHSFARNHQVKCVKTQSPDKNNPTFSFMTTYYISYKIVFIFFVPASFCMRFHPPCLWMAESTPFFLRGGRELTAFLLRLDSSAHEIDLLML